MLPQQTTHSSDQSSSQVLQTLTVNRYRGVVFDVDDSILATETLARIPHINIRTFNAALAEFFGRELSEDLRAALLAHYSSTTPKDMLPGTFRLLQVHGYLLKEVADPEELGEKLAALRIKQSLAAIAAGDIFPLPGALDRIRELHAFGLKVGLYTSARRVYMEPLLEAAFGEEFRRMVPHELRVYGCQVSGRRKPDPLGWLLASIRMGFPVSELVAVDNATVGIEGSLEAGYGLSLALHHGDASQFEKFSARGPAFQSLKDLSSFQFVRY